MGVSNANIASKKATVQRLVEQKAFARVLAPYSGIITSRTLTRGSLVAAGPTTPLFKLAAVDPVRVMVAVPQDVAPSVKTGMPAKLVVREYGSEIFNGEIARSSQALDPATRTMLVEVRVPNRDGRLLTGMSVKVSLTLPLPHRVFEVPGTAVLTDAGGVRVAVIAPNSTLKFVPIVIERDQGSTVLVSAGLNGSERIVENATGALVDGARVEPIESRPANAPPKKPGS
ncbi:MAG: efflux RND transporter periplasmic adaptor subunit [Polyangiaceae bacterium]|nr:efflux RND transporter periplasmic adaptor subunit [Polyangiaceae bacterium]